VRCVLHHADGTTEDFTCNHTMSEEHIDWFRAGGALNVIRKKYLPN
jgi:aconitate hydratase